MQSLSRMVFDARVHLRSCLKRHAPDRPPVVCEQKESLACTRCFFSEWSMHKRFCHGAPPPPPPAAASRLVRRVRQKCCPSMSGGPSTSSASTAAAPAAAAASTSASLESATLRVRRRLTRKTLGLMHMLRKYGGIDKSGLPIRRPPEAP